jgi:hypothetical protein
LIEATLLERKLVDGKPTLLLVCRLAVIAEDKTGETAAAEKLWHDASAWLGRFTDSLIAISTRSNATSPAGAEATADAGSCHHAPEHVCDPRSAHADNHSLDCAC